MNIRFTAPGYLWAPYSCSPCLLRAAGAPVHLDLRNGSIGTVTVTDHPAQIEAKLDAANVQAYTGHSGGESCRGYKLSFPNGEIVDANQMYFEIDSSAFQTRERLVVGSTWQDFRAAYSDGSLSWSTGADAIWSEKYKFRLYFEGNQKSAPGDRVIEMDLNGDGAAWW